MEFKEVTKQTENQITLHSREYVSKEVHEYNPIWYQKKFSIELVKIIYFKSGWGNEYRECIEELGTSFFLTEQTGRSSGTFSPFFIIQDKNEYYYSFSLFYSGNWQITIKKNLNGQSELTIGFEPEFRTIMNQTNFITPQVGSFEGPDLLKHQKIWQQFSNQSMRDVANLKIPIVWNHWWAYEDQAINSELFKKNAKEAAELGIELCLLDAGWFGERNHWAQVKGDWTNVNAEKFPAGLAELSQTIRNYGMKFGLWFEIEGIGKRAKLNNSFADHVATRADNDLGYLCFGNHEIVTWAVAVVSQAIEEYQCSWIKFDFNVEPGKGCADQNHDHGTEDGLYYHYQGLYDFFDQLKEKYPTVIFENCSSGGLRTDHHLLSKFHVNYLSDPDYPTHKIRCLKNATKFIHPMRILSFVPSETIEYEGETRAFINSDFSQMTEVQIRAYMRLGMLTRTGLSHRLIDYDGGVKKIIKEEISLYKRLRPLLEETTSYFFNTEKGLDHHFFKSKQNSIFIFNHDAQVKQVSMIDLAKRYGGTITQIYLDDQLELDLNKLPETVSVEQSLIAIVEPVIE